MTQPEQKTLTIDMEPVGRRVEITPGTTLLSAAQQSGVGLVSLCGGEGWCESCVVKVVEGECSPHTRDETETLSQKELAAGYRLACQAEPLTDVKLDIPPGSLSTPQRLQVEGQETATTLNPAVQAFDLKFPPASLEDQRSDATRLKDVLLEAGQRNVEISLAVLADFSERLRKYNWSARVVLRDNVVIAVLPENTPILGLAVDIGSTKVAGYLINLETGETLSRTGAMNPQIAYGEDILSRISYSREHADGRAVMQAKVVETLNAIAEQMCTEVEAKREHIVDAVFVGNTAMHHFFAGLPVTQLALAPYVPAVSDSLDVPAALVGLKFAPGAIVHLLPNIAGYVGADHVSVLIATQLQDVKPTTLAVDIGTNTEITLAHEGHLYSCSCASGPAFEGAHIHDGMRAAPGAIERVQIVDGGINLYTIDNEPPVGMCGSGILDVVAEMYEAGILDRRGAMDLDQPRVRQGEKLIEYVLVEAADTGHGKDITMTRKDVNEIQLAKAAIRAGLEILMLEAGITATDIEDFIIAGAFGTYIDVPNAIKIGMFPDIPLERFEQIGNAAGSGARMALLDKSQRTLADEIVPLINYVELTTFGTFQDIFLNAMYL